MDTDQLEPADSERSPDAQNPEMEALEELGEVEAVIELRKPGSEKRKLPGDLEIVDLEEREEEGSSSPKRPETKDLSSFAQRILVEQEHLAMKRKLEKEGDTNPVVVATAIELYCKRVREGYVEWACEAAKLLDRRGQRAAATEYYTQGAVGGDAKAQLEMGRRCLKGIGQEISDTEAFRWFALAGESGEILGKYQVAKIKERKSKTLDEKRLALMLFQEIEDDPAADYELSRKIGCYIAKLQLQVGVLKNLFMRDSGDVEEQLAFASLQQISAGSQPQKWFIPSLLGYCYFHGIGIASNHHLAAATFEKMAGREALATLYFAMLSDDNFRPDYIPFILPFVNKMRKD